jgi:transcriptional regulator with XRE-family HTH domain
MPPDHKQITREVRELRRSIGANIHAARAARRMKLEKLSRLCGLRPGTIDMLEIGKGETDLRQIAAIARALNIDAMRLLSVNAEKQG